MPNNKTRQKNNQNPSSHVTGMNVQILVDIYCFTFRVHAFEENKHPPIQSHPPSCN